MIHEGWLSTAGEFFHEPLDEIYRLSIYDLTIIDKLIIDNQ